MKNIIWINLLAIIIFTSCRPQPLEIQIDPLAPEAVVFSQVIPGQVVTVALTQTISALDFSEDEGDSLSNDIVDELLISNAKITVSYRDQIDSLYQLTNGVYASITTPLYFDEPYTLDITTPDGRVLTSTSTMLTQALFTSVLPVIERTADDTLVTIEYSFNDLPGDNWYMINCYTNGDPVDDGLDLNSFFGNGNNLLKKTELLSDLTFENNLVEGTIELPNVSATDSLVVTLSNINEDYYNFLDLRKSSQNFFSEVTKEPVSLPTNIEGGLGFFNTHFPDIQYYDLNEF